MHGKALLLFSTLLLSYNGLNGAASSNDNTETLIAITINGKEHHFNKAGLLKMPYFQALLQPKEIGKLYYGIDANYSEISDQENMAKLPQRKLLERIIGITEHHKEIALELNPEEYRSFIIMYNYLQKMNNNSSDDEILKNKLKTGSISIEQLYRTAFRFLTFESLRKAFDKHEIELLKQSLPVSDIGVISGALFSPAQNMLETLLSLIKAEMKQIRIACYMLSNHEIIDELIRASHRGVQIKIIVDAIDNKSSIDLRRAHLPFYAWDKAKGISTPHRPKMHNKFFIFSENIFGQSLIITGSANCTASAQNNNRENIVVSNNKGLITQFADRFTYLEKSSQQITFKMPPSLLPAGPVKDISAYAPEATRLFQIISQIFQEKGSAKRSSRPTSFEESLRPGKHNRNT